LLQLGQRQTIDLWRDDHRELESNRPASEQEKNPPPPGILPLLIYRFVTYSFTRLPCPSD
ncbi:MAG: hypothetical protein ACREFP_03760, partial [Acetobacteraceae bacterium]